jgi:tRNA A37 methylthiotransferase MiaB
MHPAYREESERLPGSSIATDIIVGFPGETEDDVDELERFLTAARLDAIGVFGYSDEDGTEAFNHDEKIAAEVIAARVERITSLAEELTAQRAEDRIGETVKVLVESIEGDVVEGRSAHQAPEVDGITILIDDPLANLRLADVKIGDIITASVERTDGVDLVASVIDRRLTRS